MSNLRIPIIHMDWSETEVLETINKPLELLGYISINLHEKHHPLETYEWYLDPGNLVSISCYYNESGFSSYVTTLSKEKYVYYYELNKIRRTKLGRLIYE